MPHSWRLLDVLLLADAFETFRKTCMRQYGLGPARYHTSPGLSWDALFKTTGAGLELLADFDQHIFIEKGLRGGISKVSKRLPHEPITPGSRGMTLPSTTATSSNWMPTMSTFGQ